TGTGASSVFSGTRGSRKASFAAERVGLGRTAGGSRPGHREFFAALLCFALPKRTGTSDPFGLHRYIPRSLHPGLRPISTFLRPEKEYSGRGTGSGRV